MDILVNFVLYKVFFKVTASLYEFKHDRIRKIQKIDTDNADEVLNYSYFGEQYLMIFTDTTSVSVYFWTGMYCIITNQIVKLWSIRCGFTR